MNHIIAPWGIPKRESISTTAGISPRERRECPGRGRRKSLPPVAFDPFGDGRWEDVLGGPLSNRATGVPCGRAEPARSSKTVWAIARYSEEDAAALGAAGIPAQRAAEAA